MKIPCDCKGGTFVLGQFTGSYTQSVDCGNKMAYLHSQEGITGFSTKWLCANKPQMKFTAKTQCPCTTFQETMHSSCYLLQSTHKALNLTNPDLASNCWLCLAQGTHRPLALPANLTLAQNNANSCKLNIPLKV